MLDVITDVCNSTVLIFIFYLDLSGLWPPSGYSLTMMMMNDEGSTQRAKTAWTKVKDMVTPAGIRRGSADLLGVASTRGLVDGRSSSAEPPSRVPANDEADPWIEKRPLSKHRPRSISINQLSIKNSGLAISNFI